MTQRWRIGELATHHGINPKTIRYYEELGLLPPPARSAAGYRLYTEADRERLVFIGKAKAIGLTLADIRKILALRDAGSEPCDHVVALLNHKLASVDTQLQALATFRQELLTLRNQASTAPKADGCICSIIEQGGVSQTVPTGTRRQAARRSAAATL